MKQQRNIVLLVLAILSSACFGLFLQGQNGSAGPAGPLSPAALRTWLSVLASDEFEGRATFSPGLDKAAAYIAERLKEAGAKPAGDNGTYLQSVSVLTVQSMNASSLEVEVNGQRRVYRNGDGVWFTPNVGSKRTLVLDDVEFAGYGLNLGRAYNDYAGRDVRGKAVVWLGQSAPDATEGLPAGRMMESRASTAIDEMGAAASISLAQGRRNGRNGSFTTSQRLDLPRPVEVLVSEEILEFLFSASGLDYENLKSRANRREPLRPATLKGIRLTFNLDAEYRVTNTRTTQNVVATLDGADPKLKETYVAFGAHYDHLGVETSVPPNSGADRIHNGADDDGSGSTALIGLVHAFAGGPKTRRSLLFAWHAGEERGLWGSQYLAEHPPVPMDRIVAQLNIDMIGRNRDNKASESNTVYAVGADRISSDLHDILIDANAALPQPMTIDFEMNDPSDPERIYFRSDHFSYAAKGIPVIFFFTGLHPDYHRVTDEVDKILFDKMSRIAHLVYETGRIAADRTAPPARDFKGAQMGNGSPIRRLSP